MIQRKSILLCIVMLAGAGVLTRWIDIRRLDGAAGFTPLNLTLSAIPERLGSWSLAQVLPIESDVLRTADVDEFVHRSYLNRSNGNRVTLYVGYWGRENVGTGHGPDVCYPAVGWSAESEPIEGTIQWTDSQNENGARVALHRFSRWGVYDTERLAVAFTAVVDGEYRASSLGSFSHRPRRFYECGGPFLAHVQVASPVANADWEAAEANALEFLDLLLPALDNCLPQTECDESEREPNGALSGASLNTSDASSN